MSEKRGRGKDKKPRKTDNYKGNKNSDPSKLPGAETDLPEGYNTNKIRFMRMIIPDTPIDTNDIEEMKRRFDRYLSLCEQYDQKVGNQAAYAAIGLTKEQVWDFINRNKSNPTRSDFLKKVQQICGIYRESLMEDGKVNPVTGIFWQKNYDGMRDAQEIVVSPAVNPLGDGESAERLAEKYLEQTKGIEQKDIIDLPVTQKEAEKET